MAIDTAEKRFSMMGVGIPFIKHVIPQGALGKSGRATLMDLYSGIPLEELTIINLRHSWDYVTQDIDTMKIQTSVDSLKLKVNNS